jgi:NADH dehydrogenase
VLERRGIEIRLKTRVAGATAEGVVLDDGSSIPARTLVAAIGAAPNRVLEKLPCPRDQKGRLIVDASLAVAGYPGLWSVVDCAAVPDTVKDGTCPPTAQYAVREARHLAKNILAAVQGSTMKPFACKSLGVFVPLGRFSGAAQIMGVNVSGLLAWWMYRTYYLFQLPRMKRKIQVFIDWNLELLFRRDIVHLDITRSQQTTRSHYEPGQIVFNQGDLARGFFIILDGQVEVVRQREGVEELVATLGPGEYFGEISLLFGVRHTATIRALTTVDLLIMNGNDFTALANSSSDFRNLLGGVMRQRLSDWGVESPEEIHRQAGGDATEDHGN